ncbi:hypothetical protein TL16_g07809 [Triparma laevis f. inornata]|uniref:Ribosomal RNA-processing protein 14/surfeit locus protein 6 C-terminal domain-containing protein n=2 Tax=Triparma laevis TaxID=1534972 RepID=A0A9W6Z9C8_9STRA|nr:hypothetical protein TrLO_g14257 [Triparma laevis f. longispina]GMH78463.1 hypothetical protein TL16_g07809 [Triparma laevis f. inornata]
MTMLSEALSHQTYFDSLTNMIPSTLYITETTNVEDDEKGALHANKFKKGQNKESKERKKAEEKLRKKEKFSTRETTVEKKKKKWEEIEAENENSEDDDDDEEEEEGEGSSDIEVEDMEVEGENAGLSKIEILRKKLALKIEKKRNGRPENGAENVSKRAARKAAKLKKKEEGKKKTSTTGFSGAEKSKSNPVRGRASTDGTTDSSNSDSANKNNDPSHDLSTIDFGGISGLKTVSSHKANKSLSNVSKSKNLNHLLEKANAKKARLNELKNGTAEDKKKREDIMWGDTMKEANGVRVRDDPAMIKKAIKRKEKSKAKSAAKWADRITTVADSMHEKQKIRKHNLEKRKLGGKQAANLSHKEIKDDEADGEKKKRRRLGVGFEGKKEEFLNGGKKGGREEGGKGGRDGGKQ